MEYLILLVIVCALIVFFSKKPHNDQSIIYVKDDFEEIDDYTDIPVKKKSRQTEKIHQYKYFFEDIQYKINFVKPLEEKPIEVKGEDCTYILNLFQMTCTCPSFAKRKQFAKDDIRRPCKHLWEKLRRRNMLGEQEELAQKLILIDFRSEKENMVISKTQSGVPVLFCFDYGDWIDVYSRRRKKVDIRGTYSGLYDRCGFSKSEDRWSYGYGPPGASELREMINQLRERI